MVLTHLSPVPGWMWNSSQQISLKRGRTSSNPRHALSFLNAKESGRFCPKVPFHPADIPLHCLKEGRTKREGQGEEENES